MLDKNQLDIAAKILTERENGRQFAAYKLGEELAELTKELFKQFNVGKEHRQEIIEEMGDVICNMEFVMIAMNISEKEIKSRVNEKFNKIVDKARRQGINV
jgi:NTP pyrophosphatase (non-canonical NTP hydrolase)